MVQTVKKLLAIIQCGKTISNSNVHWILSSVINTVVVDSSVTCLLKCFVTTYHNSDTAIAEPGIP